MACEAYSPGDNLNEIARKILSCLQGGGGVGDIVQVSNFPAVQAVSQSGAWTATVSGTVAATQSGVWNVNATTASPSGAYTNRSGTLAAAATSQPIAAANASRKAFFFQNLSNESLWVNFTTLATQSQPSIEVLPKGVLWLTSEFITTEAINVIGATLGSAFAAKEG